MRSMLGSLSSLSSIHAGKPYLAIRLDTGRSSTFLSGRSLYCRRPNSRDKSLQTTAAYGVGTGDRLLAAIPYLLPLFDGLRYGRFFLTQFPIFTRLIAPLFPLYQVFMTIPFSSVVAFFGIYLGLVQNTNINRYVRFNAMQAILVDILLFLPSLVESLFKPNLDITVVGYNTVWVYVFACVVYGVGSCLMGEQPRLPLVADAADSQVR